MEKYKIYINGILEFVTESPCAASDTVGHYIDKFNDAGFTLVYKGGTAFDMHYIFYSDLERKSGTLCYVIE